MMMNIFVPLLFVASLDVAYSNVLRSHRSHHFGIERQLASSIKVTNKCANPLNMFIMHYDSSSATFITKNSPEEVETFGSLEQTSPESHMTFMIAAKDVTTGLNVFSSDDGCLMFDSKCWVYSNSNMDITCGETIPTKAPTKAPSKAPASPPSLSVMNNCDKNVDIKIKYFDIFTMSIREESASIAPDAYYNHETGKVSEMLVSQKIDGIDTLAPYCDSDVEGYMTGDGVCWKLQSPTSDISYDYEPVCPPTSDVKGRILEVTSYCTSTVAPKVKLFIREKETSPGIPSVSGSKFKINIKEGSTKSFIEDKPSSDNFYVAGKHIDGPSINSDIFQEKCKKNMAGYHWIDESLDFKRCYRQIPKGDVSNSVSKAELSNCYFMKPLTSSVPSPSPPTTVTDPTPPSGKVCY